MLNIVTFAIYRHFKSIGSPLLSIDAFPTLASQIKRHLKAGFGVYSHSDLHSSFCNLPVEERNRIENLEMFDEFEGWHQMCLHYFVLCTTNSSLAHLRKFCLHCFKWNYSDSGKTFFHQNTVYGNTLQAR